MSAEAYDVRPRERDTLVSGPVSGYPELGGGGYDNDKSFNMIEFHRV